MAAKPIEIYRSVMCMFPISYVDVYVSIVCCLPSIECVCVSQFRTQKCNGQSGVRGQSMRANCTQPIKENQNGETFR